jgi:hypothetical protein
MVILRRFEWVEGAFEPALFVLAIVVALGVAYVIREFWLRGK